MDFGLDECILRNFFGTVLIAMLGRCGWVICSGCIVIFCLYFAWGDSDVGGVLSERHDHLRKF